MNKLSRFFILALLAFVVTFTGLFILAGTAQADSNPPEGACRWVTSGEIECQRPNAIGGFIDRLRGVYDSLPTPDDLAVIGDTMVDPFQFRDALDNTFDGGACGGTLPTAECSSYYYQPGLSASANYPIFCMKSADGLNINTDSGTVDTVCLHFNVSNPVSPDFAILSDSPNRASNIIGASRGPRVIALANASNGLIDPSSQECGVTRTTNCDVNAGAIGGPEFYTGAALDTTAFLESLSASAAGNNCEDALDNPLSFVLCPISDFLNDTLTKMITAVTKLLENPDLTKSQNLKDAVSSMITLANSFYILIFMFIILANFVAVPGLDNYTVKKALPKLIVAIILTQFSLLICQAVLDLGNILAITLPNLLLRAFPGVVDLTTGAGNPITPAGAFSATIVPSLNNVKNTGDVFEALGKFAIFNLTMLVGVVVTIIAFIYILARYLFLLGLVLSAPLAFAAWVLPNTEQFFKKWWQYFLKLSIMFLLVNLLFVLGAVFSFLFAEGDLTAGGASGGFANFMGSIISILIPIVVLVLVPKTLKMSGAIMAKAKEAGSKAIANAKDTRAGKAISKSAQEGQLAKAKSASLGKAADKFGGANTKLGRSLQRKSGVAKSGYEKKQAEGYDTLSDDQLIAQHNAGDKNATKTLRKKYLSKAAESKTSYDAGATLNADEQKKFNELASHTGGRNYHQAAMYWETANQARLNPNLTHAEHVLAAQHEVEVVRGIQPPPPAAGGPGGPGGAGGHGAPGAPGAPAPAGMPGPPGAPAGPAGPAGAPAPGPAAPPPPPGHGGPAHPGPAAPPPPPGHGGPGHPPPGGGPPPPPPVGGPWSDIRLKRNVKLVNKLENGIKIYRFKYLWSNTEYVGVMAQDTLLTHPSAVLTDKLGFYSVDYTSLGLQMVTHQEYLANPSSLHLAKIQK